MAGRTHNETLAKEAGIMRRLGEEVAALHDMNMAQLKARYREVYGEEPRSKNLPFLRKKLAFRLQERVEGGLSPYALARIEELAPKELEPVKTPKGQRAARVPPEKKVVLQVRDPRLPEVGTVLKREFRGCTHEVEVLDQGFRYLGRNFNSLSTIAKEITGTAWNGFGFFGLMKGRHDGQA